MRSTRWMRASLLGTMVLVISLLAMACTTEDGTPSPGFDNGTTDDGFNDGLGGDDGLGTGTPTPAGGDDGFGTGTPTPAGGDDGFGTGTPTPVGGDDGFGTGTPTPVGGDDGLGTGTPTPFGGDGGLGGGTPVGGEETAQGSVVSVNAETQTLSVQQTTGETVDVTTDETTNIMVDGERADLEAIEQGAEVEVKLDPQTNRATEVTVISEATMPSDGASPSPEPTLDGTTESPALDGTQAPLN